MSGEILQDFSCEFIHEGDSCKLVDFLVAENAKLRGQYEAVIDDYRSEVAKLRELCRYLLPFAESCGAEHPLMRELEIEVDDDTE